MYPDRPISWSIEDILVTLKPKRKIDKQIETALSNLSILLNITNYAYLF